MATTTEPCEIIFNNPYKTYFAGETVTGRVEVIFNKPKIITGIYLHIKGGTQFNWSKGGSGKPKRIIKEYFSVESILVSATEHDEFTLPPGKHIYPFSHVLQQNLPTTLEKITGHTRYIVEVNIERLWKWNHVAKSEFTVIAPLNLNNVPKAKQSSTVSVDKHFCCLCCKSGLLTCVVNIPKTGFVCGEAITFVIELDNGSNVKISKIYLNFIQFIKYFKAPYKSNHKTEKQLIESIELGLINPHESKTWTQNYSIPSLPPSTTSAGPMIQLHYEFLVEAKTDNLHENVKLVVPIIIGTTSITNDVSTLPNLTTSAQVSQTNIPTGPTITFEESKISNVESVNYKPYYPIYNFENS